MSPPGRPKGEFRSAQHEGSPVSPPGRPKGEFRSAQHEGSPVSPPGRPKGEFRSAQHEGSPVSPPGRPKGMGFKDLSLNTTEWYCKGVGLVKVQRAEPAHSTFLAGGTMTLEWTEWQ